MESISPLLKASMVVLVSSQPSQASRPAIRMSEPYLINLEPSILSMIFIAVELDIFKKEPVLINKLKAIFGLVDSLTAFLNIAIVASSAVPAAILSAAAAPCSTRDRPPPTSVGDGLMSDAARVSGGGFTSPSLAFVFSLLVSLDFLSASASSLAFLSASSLAFFSSSSRTFSRSRALFLMLRSRPRRPSIHPPASSIAPPSTSMLMFIGASAELRLMLSTDSARSLISRSRRPSTRLSLVFRSLVSLSVFFMLTVSLLTDLLVLSIWRCMAR